MGAGVQWFLRWLSLIKVLLGCTSILYIVPVSIFLISGSDSPESVLTNILAYWKKLLLITDFKPVFPLSTNDIFTWIFQKDQFFFERVKEYLLFWALLVLNARTDMFCILYLYLCLVEFNPPPPPKPQNVWERKSFYIYCQKILLSKESARRQNVQKRCLWTSFKKHQ